MLILWNVKYKMKSIFPIFFYTGMNSCKGFSFDTSTVKCSHFLLDKIVKTIVAHSLLFYYFAHLIFYIYNCHQLYSLSF